MVKRVISGGTVHIVPHDLRVALAASPQALVAWEDITALARNEWICWAVSVKQQETRNHHVARVVIELIQGKRRPCCWMGCIHRTDKVVSHSVRGILLARQSRKGNKK
jgi:hypothetical protein